MMSFTPSGVLVNDYSAFCESLQLIEREDIHSAISTQARLYCKHNEEVLHEQEQQQQRELHKRQKQQPKEEEEKEEEPLVNNELVPINHFTSVKLRHPNFCVNHRDITPLTMSMPFCTSLVYVELTGCGLSEFAYHKLVEAIYKCLRVIVVKVDFNSPQNKGFYNDPLLTNAGDGSGTTPVILLKPTEFCGLHCFPTVLEEQIQEEKQKRGKVDSKKLQQLQSQKEALEQFNMCHAFAMPKRWAGVLLTGVVHLSLRANGINDNDVHVMSEILLSHKWSQLISLNLWDNLITDKGAAELARVLHGSVTLRVLDVGHNLLSDKGVMILINTLRMQEVHGMSELLTRRRKVLTRPGALETERQRASQMIMGTIPTYQDIFNLWYVDHFPLLGNAAAAATAATGNADNKSKETTNLNTNNNNNNNNNISSSSNSSGVGSNVTSAGKNRNKPDPQQSWIAMIKQIQRPTAPFDNYCVKIGNVLTTQIPNATSSTATNTTSSTTTTTATTTIGANSNISNIFNNTINVEDTQNTLYRIPGNTVLEVLNLSENKHVTLHGMREVLQHLALHEPRTENEMLAMTIATSTETERNYSVLPSPSKHGRRKSSNITSHMSSTHGAGDNNYNNNTITSNNNNTMANTYSQSNRSFSQSNMEFMNKFPHVQVPESYCVHLHLFQCDVRNCHEFNRNEWDEINNVQEQINSLLAERLCEVMKQEEEMRVLEQAAAVNDAQRRAANATPNTDSRHGSAKRRERKEQITMLSDKEPS